MVRSNHVVAAYHLLLVECGHVMKQEASVGDVVVPEASGEKFVSLDEMYDDIIIPDEE